MCLHTHTHAAARTGRQTQHENLSAFCKPLLKTTANMRTTTTPLLTPFSLTALFHYFSECHSLSSQGHFIHSYRLVLYSFSFPTEPSSPSSPTVLSVTNTPSLSCIFSSPLHYCFLQTYSTMFHPETETSHNSMIPPPSAP